MSCRFEWNDVKARSNQTKHGVSFDEAATVFDDSLAWIFDDELHSINEAVVYFGHSIKNRLILICFAERPKEMIRIISARLPTKKERKDYEETVDRKARSSESEEILPEYNFDYKKAKPIDLLVGSARPALLCFWIQRCRRSLLRLNQ